MSLAASIGLAFGLTAGAQELVLHYDCLEGTGSVLTDAAPYGNHGEIHGPAWESGEWGASLRFNGASDYVDAGNDASLRIDGAITLLCRLRHAPAALNQYVLSKYGWNIYIGPDNVPRFETRNAANTAWETLPAAGALPTGRWVHVSAVYRPANSNLEIYVDGLLGNTAARTDGALGGVDGHALVLGAYQSSQYFAGALGELKVYSGALSPEQIMADHRNGLSRFGLGPAAAYGFREGAGTVAHDDSGYANHGRIEEAAWRAGTGGSVLLFDGFNDWVDAGDGGSLHISGALTITTWVNANQVSANQYVLGKYGWNLYIDTANRPNFETRDASNTVWNTLYGTTSLTTGQWHFVACVYDPDEAEMRLYVNGVLDNAKPRTDGALGGVAGYPLILGRYQNGSQRFCGLLSETRIHARALTAAELLAAFQLQGQDKDDSLSTWRWTDSQAGISDGVLPPWSPVALQWQGSNNVSVEVWGRTYGFNALPFPQSVLTRNVSVLTGPVRLKATVNGSDETLAPQAISVNMQTPAAVGLLQQSSSANLQVTAQTSVEYDGMIRVDWEIAAPAPVQLQALTLEVPYHAANAAYLYYYPHYERDWSDHRPGALPPQGFVDDFRPEMWLGDEDRGFMWFSESDTNWFNADPGAVTEVVRSGDTGVVLRLHVVSTGVDLNPGAPLTYTFGFQATPVKPVELTAWDRRIFVINQGTYGAATRLQVPPAELDALADRGVRTVIFFEHWTDAESYTDTAYGDDMRTFVTACHARGLQVLLYFGFLLSDLAPEWRTWSDACLIEPRAGYEPYNYPPQPLQNAYKVCYRSAWQDGLAEGIARMMDEYDVDGVYLDGTSSPFGGCKNEQHDCGYRRDGALRPTYAFFPTRAMLRRIRAIVKSRKPDGQVDVHQSAHMNMPALGFATTYWDGEQLSDRTYPAPLERLPMDMFRCEFMGRQWGVPAEFLYYVWGTYTGISQEQSFAMPLLHDVPVRTHLVPELTIPTALWEIMDEFGRTEAEFMPYWDNAGVVTAAPAGVYASLYRHPRGRVLTVVSNMGSTPTTATVALNVAELGLAGRELTLCDARSGEGIAIDGGQFEVDLEPFGWKLVQVVPGAGTHLFVE